MNFILKPASNTFFSSLPQGLFWNLPALLVRYPIQVKAMPFRQGDAVKNSGTKHIFYLPAKIHSSHSTQWSATSVSWLLIDFGSTGRSPVWIPPFTSAKWRILFFLPNNDLILRFSCHYFQARLSSVPFHFLCRFLYDQIRYIFPCIIHLHGSQPVQ